MSAISSDQIPYQDWLQEDINPFYAFNQKGKLLFMNKSATNISHFIDLKQVFQLALNDAPFNFGYQLIEKKSSILQIYLLCLLDRLQK